MKYGRSRRVETGALLLVAGMVLAGSDASAQAHPAAVPDAQVESNVLKALATDQRLASTTIKSTTVYGTVTLSGSVSDEATRTAAETVVSRTAGVLKVVDELTLVGSGAESPLPTPNTGQGTNPNLQSDGTMASPDAQAQADAKLWGPAGPPPTGDVSQAPGQYADGTRNQGHPSSPYPSPYPQQTPYPQQNGSAPAYPPNGPQNYPSQNYPPQNYPQPIDQAQGGSVQPGYGPPPPQSTNGIYPNYGGQPNYGGGPQGSPSPGYPGAQQYPYATGPGGQQGYNGTPQPGGANPAYAGQAGGQIVAVPSGTVLRVRMNRGIGSRNVQPGTAFDGTVVNDVIASGAIAIPRGSSVHGVVVDAESAGVLKGRGEIQLQLTQVTLGGTTYPIASNIWSVHGSDKTVRTVDSAIGLGAVGAVLGAVAGGGAGAAIGAGVGGAVGVGSSAASGAGQVGVPPESILDFHLVQPVQVATLSQAELDRLGYGVPAGGPRGMVRRYPGPYYGPVIYGPRPYYYPGYYPRYYRSYPY